MEKSGDRGQGVSAYILYSIISIPEMPIASTG